MGKSGMLGKESWSVAGKWRARGGKWKREEDGQKKKREREEVEHWEMKKNKTVVKSKEGK